MNDINKWNGYYSDADMPPPWESTKPYHGLVSFMEDIHIRTVLGLGGLIGGGVGGAFSSSALGKSNVHTIIKSEDQQRRGDDNAKRAIQKGAYVCELGAGCSASAVFLSELEFNTTAVDLSPLARERFFTIFRDDAAAHRVNYVIGDVLDLKELQHQILVSLSRFDESYVGFIDHSTAVPTVIKSNTAFPTNARNNFGGSSISLLSPNWEVQSYQSQSQVSVGSGRFSPTSFALSNVAELDEPHIYDPYASVISAETDGINSESQYTNSSSSTLAGGNGSYFSDYSTQLLKRGGSSSGPLKSWPILGNKRTDTGSIVSVNTGDSLGTPGFQGATERLRTSSQQLSEQALQWRADRGEPGWSYCTTKEFDAAKASRAELEENELSKVEKKGKEIRARQKKFDPSVVSLNDEPNPPKYDHSEVYIQGGMGGSSIGMTRDSYSKAVPANWQRVEHGETSTNNVKSLMPSELRPSVNTNPFVNASAPGIFSFIFDMQCFHVLRDIDEEKAVDAIVRLLKPGGYAMIVVGANPRHSECSLEEVLEMKRRKAAKRKRAEARAAAREEKLALETKLEWERLNGKQDKYSHLKVERKILQHIDEEINKQKLAEKTGTQDRVLFINDREQYFVLSKEGYRVKDAQDKLDQVEEEKLLKWDKSQAALEAENDALSEQALGTHQTSIAGLEHDSLSMSLFDGSSLESATILDLDAASVGSFDRSVLTQWQHMGSYQYEESITSALRNSPITVDVRTLNSSVRFADSNFFQPLQTSFDSAVHSSVTTHASEDIMHAKIPNMLPDDLSTSTDHSSFPTLQSLPSISPTRRFLNTNLVTSPTVHAATSVGASSAASTKVFLKSPYFLRGEEPSRPFSPPTFMIPDTTGKNWSRQVSSYDEMMEREAKEKRDGASLIPGILPAASSVPARRGASQVLKTKDIKNDQTKNKRLPGLFDPLASTSSPASFSSPLSHMRQPQCKAVTSKPGPPRLYKAELVTPFTEHDEFPLHLEYCRLSTFNTTAAYQKMFSVPVPDIDSDEEAWAEMDGVSQVSANLSANIKAAPLCWEAVFRKGTQEEVLQDIY